jgi:hypothetical protein
MAKNDNIYDQEYLNHSRMGERRQFAMADVSGRGGEAVIEVNWNKLVKNKGYIKFSIEDKEVVLSREHLYAILFIVGSAEEQEKMVSPFLKKTHVTKYTKVIGITTTKDIAKGETINVPLEFTLNPETQQVVIGRGSMSAIERAVQKDITSKK